MKDTLKYFGYIRFSSDEQKRGDSIERQRLAIKEYAESEGIDFKQFEIIIDEGKSAFEGRHISSEGELGKFLQTIKASRPPEGSILAVENHDRLTRQGGPEMFSILSQLKDSGLLVRVLKPYLIRYPEEIRSHGIVGFVDAMRANEESERKRELSLRNAKKKRDNCRENPNTIFTRRTKEWVEIDAATGMKKLKVGAHDSLTMLFELRAKGIGPTRIARILNEKAPWKPEKREVHDTGGWRLSYVTKVLRDRAVIGEFQPHIREGKKHIPEGEPIKDYYPVAVEPDLFYEVQNKLQVIKEKHGNGGGRVEKFGNVFRSIVRCGYCGRILHYIDKKPNTNVGKYLCCQARFNGERNEDGSIVCNAKPVRYGEVYDLVINNLKDLKPEDLLPNQSALTKERKGIIRQLNSIDGQIKDCEKVESNLDKLLSLDLKDDDLSDYHNKRKDNRKKLENLQENKRHVEVRLRMVENDAKQLGSTLKEMNDLLKALDKDIDTRVRLNDLLKTRLIEKIEVFGEGHDDTVEEIEAMVEEYMPQLMKPEVYQGFIKWVRERCLSHYGRFYRIHTVYKGENRRAKDGKGVFQVAPADSYAGGMEWVTKEGRKTIKFHGADLSRLAKEYFDGRALRHNQFKPRKNRIKGINRIH